MYYTDRDVLLTEHFRLQKDINDIQSQIRKLEKTNQLLDQQNRQLKVELEAKYGTNQLQNEFVKQSYFTNSGLSKFLDKQYLVEKLNKASEICEVATGEIMKHAKYVADGVSCKLLNNNVLNNSILNDNLSTSLLRTNLLNNSFHPNTFMPTGLNDKLTKLDSIMGDTVTTNLSSNESSVDAHLVMSSDDEPVFPNQVKHTGQYELN